MGYKKGQVLRTAFDQYTIVRPKGAGASGEVYEVLDTDGLAFAVKVLDQTKITSARLKRFKNEIHFCSRNVHANIVRVIASGVGPDDAPFFVMPLYAETMRQLLGRRVDASVVLRYFGQILDGVEAAHLQNVWHRDLKPENVLFDPSQKQLVVADFGIAHFEEDELLTAVETRNNERLANFLYSAPEQRIRGQAVDSKADIYALGLMLNEMFTGTVPQGTGFRTIAQAAADFVYVDGVIEKMLQQEPSRRPSIADIKRELIARGNDFLSEQRLNRLKSEVIREAEINDPVIDRPIEVVQVDFLDDRLLFTLSATPPQNWIMAFTRPTSSWSSYPGSGPESFSFRGDVASVGIQPGMSPKTLVNYTRQYVDLANKQYAELTIAEHRKRMAGEHELRRAAIAKEEYRQRVLREIQS